MNLKTLKSIGISIWWSEGTKSRLDKRWKIARTYPVEVTNTNPQIIKTFLLFLREIIKTPNERISVQVQVHQGDDRTKLEDYWSHITGIPKTRFNKTIIRPVGNKVGKSLGTCKVRFADKSTYIRLEKILNEELNKIGLNDHGIRVTGHSELNPLE